jgi:hydrogenase maturation protease
MRTLILCVGNESISDDGIGARIGEILQSLPLPANIQVDVVARLRLDVLDQLVDVDHLVIVDGLTAEAEPGTSTVVDVTGHSAAVVASGCCHSRDVADIIRLARDVAPDGAEFMITIAGVRVEHVDRYGATFSQAVLSAVSRIVDLLLLTTGAGLQLRLFAAESLRQSDRQSDRISREPSAFCSWREGYELSPNFQ